MILFFLFIFVVYGSVHVYAFLRARSVFAFGPVAGAVLAAFMLLMICALFLIRSLEQHEFELTARVFAYIAYFWMAGLFLFFCVSLFFDVLAVITRAGGWISRSDVTAFLIPDLIVFIVIPDNGTSLIFSGIILFISLLLSGERISFIICGL